MSKLVNAPLLEVVFEIRWDIINQNDIALFQYLHGDLYSELRDNYNVRELLVPSEIPMDVLKGVPIYRFRKEINNYPLWQVGPGVLTVNVDDENYYWEAFYNESIKITAAFFKVYPSSSQIVYTPSLTYIDFFKIDETEHNILNFINENLNINLSQNFFQTDKSPDEINLNFNYSTEYGELSITLANGLLKGKDKGITLQTKINGFKKEYSIEEIDKWLTQAHTFTSDLFKKITNGKLYNSFK